jgi:DNA helicase-2/ATP-dependent DNA helicase PcrA
MAKELTDSGYLLTSEERATHFKVYAGPGAGKTHFLAHNIKNIVESEPVITTSEKRKVLCITYTNAAANELKTRLSKNTDRVVISTIHSFIGEYIIKPYQPLLKKLIREKYDIGIDENVLLHSQVEGRGLLFGHHRDDVYEYIRMHLSTEEDIQYSRVAIESVTLSINTGILSASNAVRPEHRIPIKEYLWNKAGVLSHDEVLIFGLALAKRFPIILYGLRVEFPFIFVDEFQDTNPIQTKLVQQICAKSSIAGVIGDVAQSIYSFQNAKPEDFINFTIPGDTTRIINEFVLKTNRRSKDNIVQVVNYMRQKDTSLSNQLTLKTGEDAGKVMFYIEQINPRQQGDLPAQIQSFIDSGAYVLTRTWAQTFQYIRGIDRVQSQLVNEINNFYTYQLQRDFRRTVAEFRDIAWVRALTQIAEMEDAFNRKCIPSALKAIKGIIDAKAVYSNPAKLRKFISVWQELISVIDEDKSLVFNFLEINRLMSENGDLWNSARLIDDSELLPEEPSDVDTRIYSFLDTLQYKTGRTLVNEVFLDDSKYMTVHQAKGREFKKVLVYMEPARPDGRVSYLNMLAAPNTTSENEYDRIMYVAMSRAISELGIHIKTREDFGAVTNAIDRWCERNKITRKIYEVFSL